MAPQPLKIGLGSVWLYSRTGSTIPGGVGLHGPLVLLVWAPSRQFQPKSAPDWARSISSQAFWPTSLTKKRVVGDPGSKAIRKGLRNPQAKVSWQMLPGVVLPVTLQRDVPGPWKGLVAGMFPSVVMRRIFPMRTLRSREASLAPAQPLSLL